MKIVCLRNLFCVIVLCVAAQVNAAEVPDKAAEQPRLVVQTGHAGEISSQAFSRSGKVAFSYSGNDRSIKLWDVESGREIRTFRVGVGVGAFAVSPDEKSLLIGDTPMKLWDVETGKLLRTFPVGLEAVLIGEVAFSSDGKTARTRSSVDGVIDIWDVTSGKKLGTFSDQSDAHAEFALDGKVVVESSFDDIKVRSIASWKVIRVLRDRGKIARELLKVSPDGKLILARGANSYLQIWETSSGKIRYTFHEKGKEATFSPSGNILFVKGDDGLWKLLEVESGKVLHSFGKEGNYEHPVFSPDGKIVLVQKFLNEQFDSIGVFLDVESGKEARRFAQCNSCGLGEFSPDGRAVLFSDFNELRLFDTELGNEISTIKGYATSVKSVTFTTDQKKILTASMRWELGTGRGQNISNPLAGNRESVFSNGNSELVFSPDGKSELSSFEGQIKLLDVASGSELFTFSGKDPVYSPDGKNILLKSDDHTLKLWDLATHEELQKFVHSNDIAATAFSKDSGRVVSIDLAHSLRIWNVPTGSVLRTFTVHGVVKNIALSPDGNAVLISDGKNHIRLFDTATGEEHSPFNLRRKINMPSLDKKTQLMRNEDDDTTFSLRDVPSGQVLQTFKGHGGLVTGFHYCPDGKTVVSGSVDKSVKIWNASSGENLYTFTGHADEVVGVVCLNGVVLSGSRDGLIKMWGHSDGVIATLRFTDDDKLVMTLPDGTVIEGEKAIEEYFDWDKADARAVLYFLVPMAHGDALRSFTPALDIEGINYGDPTVTSLGYSPDGKMALSTIKGGLIRLWDVATGEEIRVLRGHTSEVSRAVFSPDGTLVLSESKDSSAKLWRVSDGVLLATLYSFTDGSWVVTDPEGRFDTADLEEIKGLHWVMPDDPLTPVPLEAFMRDYYEPRLLPRILNGEKLKPIRALMDLNRVQPEVKIVSVTSDSKDLERALVEVEVSGAQKDYDRNGKKVPISTAANDLRLFRDGQLVGYIDGKVVKQGDKPYRKTFNVHLPSAMSGKEITFSAYAFNDDRVKSATSGQTFQVPSTVVAKKGNAYLIHMGVNNFDNPAWNLRFAANDAHLMRKSLSEKILKTGVYQHVVPISLISDDKEHHADKALLHAVLDRLAGKPASPLLKDLSGTEQLQPATPDDLVLITFSGHGYAEDGEFYLLTQNTGKGQGKEVTPDLLKRSISSEELSQWLKDVDAGDMTLIVDACQSAASVQGKDFKPGPMGSRGLGQLSFDKGMRILAASQADEYALEDNRLQQGLLSFALVTNGIEGFEADHEPKDQKIMLDEWLHYGVSRVPTLAEEVKTGKVQFVSRGGERSAIRVSTTGSLKPRPAQQPALFDFAKKRRQVEVAGSVGH